MELPQTKRAKMPHRRPDSMDSFDDDCQRDYENVDPSQAPPQHQVQPQRQAKAEPVVFTSKAAEQRGCGRKSLVILYVLVGASLLVSTAAIVLILLKGSKTAKQLELLHFNQSTMHSTGAELARDLKWLQSDQATLRVEVATRSICPACWLLNAGNCYYFSTVPQNWSCAKQACKDQGAQLIIIENQQEQEFLTKNSKGKNYWIGLNDINKEGTFKWIDDSSVSYSNWNRGEPNNLHRGEDCVHMYGYGKWNDVPCEMNQDGWICEKKWTC